jgi:hypothetical protein
MANVSPSTSSAIAGALFAGAIEESLAHLSEAEKFKASMALNRDFMSAQTSERVHRAVQSLQNQALASAAALIDALLDGDAERPEVI